MSGETPDSRSTVHASGGGSSSQDPSSMHFSQAQSHVVQEDKAEALKVKEAWRKRAVGLVHSCILTEEDSHAV